MRGGSVSVIIMDVTFKGAPHLHPLGHFLGVVASEAVDDFAPRPAAALNSPPVRDVTRGRKSRERRARIDRTVQPPGPKTGAVMEKRAVYLQPTTSRSERAPPPAVEKRKMRNARFGLLARLVRFQQRIVGQQYNTLLLDASARFPIGLEIANPMRIGAGRTTEGALIPPRNQKQAHQAFARKHEEARLPVFDHVAFLVQIALH